MTTQRLPKVYRVYPEGKPDQDLYVTAWSRRLAAIAFHHYHGPLLLPPGSDRLVVERVPVPIDTTVGAIPWSYVDAYLIDDLSEEEINA